MEIVVEVRSLTNQGKLTRIMPGVQLRSWLNTEAGELGIKGMSEARDGRTTVRLTPGTEITKGTLTSDGKGIQDISFRGGADEVTLDFPGDIVVVGDGNVLPGRLPESRKCQITARQDYKIPKNK